MEIPLQERLSSYLEASPGVPSAELKRARSAAAAAAKRLDEALIELGIVTRVYLETLLTTAFEVAVVDRADLPGHAILLDQLRPAYLASAQLIPLRIENSVLLLGMVNPYDDFAAKAVALKTNLSVTRALLNGQDHTALMASVYQFEVEKDAPDWGGEEVADTDLDALKESASDAPAIRAVHDIIRQAAAARASDIHLKPRRGGASVMLRVDGELREQLALSDKLAPAVLSRLKVLASLDISERRLPQDGRIRVNVAGEAIDIRMSTMPTIHGEGAVLRLLSRSANVVTLDELGFSRHILCGLESLFAATEGLILVTGPTGSGKTTTLHAALHRLARPGLNVVTIEDPVEYHLEGASQVQVDEKVGLTFPRVLRSLLRQDPDIILVGEIRDGETARIAVQAALTGHLVLATLHTNSALAAVPRLIDMGVEPYLLSAVLKGSLAQRLVRRICPHCAHSDEPRVAPCNSCGGTGYAGRLAIGELALLDPVTTGMLAAAASPTPTQLHSIIERGYIPLVEDGRARVATGEISARELSGAVDALG